MEYLWTLAVTSSKVPTILLGHFTLIQMRRMAQRWLSILVGVLDTGDRSLFVGCERFYSQGVGNWICAGPEFRYSPCKIEDVGDLVRPLSELVGDPPKDDPVPSVRNPEGQTMCTQPVKQEEPQTFP